MNFQAVDIETESLDPEHKEYALQPWRVLEGKAKITLICRGPHGFFNMEYAITREPSEAFRTHTAEGEQIYWWLWNGIFDVAWLIASGVDCSKIKWLDAMSAIKWIYRSQQTDPPDKKNKRSWSLANAAKDLLPNWEPYDEFMAVKSDADWNDQAYVERRCRLDTEATLLLGNSLWGKMTRKQQRSFIIEQEMIYPAALAWVNGCRYNLEAAREWEKDLTKERDEVLNQLARSIEGCSSELLISIVGSPKKLAILIHDIWQIPFNDKYRTGSGERSVAKAAMQFLVETYADSYPQLLLIQKYRSLTTQYTKFVKGPEKVAAYLGSNNFHHVIRLNSTYTARCTYSSKVRT